MTVFKELFFFFFLSCGQKEKQTIAWIPDWVFFSLVWVNHLVYITIKEKIELKGGKSQRVANNINPYNYSYIWMVYREKNFSKIRLKRKHLQCHLIVKIF